MVKLELDKPLEEKVKKELIEIFDSENTYPREIHGLLSSITEKDKPSKNIETRKDGTIRLIGIVHAKVVFNTYLEISGDRKEIEVDINWNLDNIESILEGYKIKYKLINFYREVDLD